MWRFALRNILSRKLRSILAIIGLSISIVSAISLLSFSIGIKHSVYKTFSVMEGMFVMQKDCLSPIFSTVNDEGLEPIRNIKGVKYAVGQLYRLVQFVEDKTTLTGGAATALTMVGIDPAESTRYPTLYNKFLKSGRMLQAGDSSQVVLSQRVADRYGKHLGDNIKIMDTVYQIVGLYESESLFLDTALIVPLQSVRKHFNISPHTFSNFYVVAYNIGNLPRIEREIEKLWPGLDAKNPLDWANEFLALTQRIDLFIIIIACIAIIVSTIGILNTMLMSITERFTEFGVLKANGWTNNNVVKLVMLETSCLGILSGLVGCLVGYVTVKALSRLLYIEPVIAWWLLPSAFLGGMFLAVVGGIYPAYRAARLNPIDAIRF